MRRVLGACLLIVSVLFYNYFVDESRLGSGTLPRADTSAALLPSSRSISGRQVVPAAYRRDPLYFLSTAPIDSLQLLPGIGPVLAERLARVRTGKSLFTRWGDLLRVKGIGPKTIEKLKELAGEPGTPSGDHR
jgi:competence protein ComEA